MMRVVAAPQNKRCLRRQSMGRLTWYKVIDEMKTVLELGESLQGPNKDWTVRWDAERLSQLVLVLRSDLWSPPKG